MLCKICGKSLQEGDKRRRYCSLECAAEAQRCRMRERMKATYVAKPKEVKPKPPRPAPQPRTCACCGKEFMPKTAGHQARTCSPNCRQKLYRQRKERRERLAGEVAQLRQMRRGGAV